MSPTNACDCHTHIFGPPNQFPYWPGRTYTPETALPEEMSALHRALHIDHVVIVTPSVYGTDNSATLFGMKVRGASARGVAVIDEETPDSDLQAMGRAGIRGIRLNLVIAGEFNPVVARRRLLTVANPIKGRGAETFNLMQHCRSSLALRMSFGNHRPPWYSIILVGPRRHSGSSSRASQIS